MARRKQVDEDLDEYDNPESADDSNDIDSLIEYVMTDINDILLDTYDKIELKVRGVIDDIVKHHV